MKRISIVFLLAVLSFFIANSSKAQENNPVETVFNITAKEKSISLDWHAPKGEDVIVVGTESKIFTAENLNSDELTANSNFGNGSAVGNGHVVYKGNGSSVKINGLVPGKKYQFRVYKIEPDGRCFRAPSIDQEYLSEFGKSNPSTPAAVVTCVCPPIAGITVTLTGTTNTGTSTASQATCPHVGYCSPGTTNNSWTGAASTGTLQYIFSAPVSSSTLRANSVNDVDYATISAFGGSGGTLSISGVVCMGVAGLVIGPLTNFTAGNDYGGVSWTVNSTGSYTMVNVQNTGASSGWVSACPTAITPAPLPIELVSLNAVCSGRGIDLKWKTASEKNNSYFGIERSYDTQNWEMIGTVAGSGTTYVPKDYFFADARLTNSSVYYRLKQNDFNGDFKYSELVFVEKCNDQTDGPSINSYPNPAKDVLTVKVYENGLTLELMNTTGQILKSQKLLAGDNILNIDDVPAGIYFLRTTREDGSFSFTKTTISK